MCGKRIADCGGKAVVRREGAGGVVVAVECAIKAVAVGKGLSSVVEEVMCVVERL